MGSFIDMVGLPYGRLTVVKLHSQSSQGSIWLCTCLCGERAYVAGYKLRTGHTKSCGCLARETREARVRQNTTHGCNKKHNRTLEYRSWNHMLSRCRNPNVPAYRDYGGRGITVCKRWLKFENFLADMGLRPTPQHTIERKNNAGNYTPSNCRWATRIEQANNKRNNHLLTAFDRTMTYAQWARETGLDQSLIRYRHKRGLPVERILAPVQKA